MAEKYCIYYLKEWILRELYFIYNMKSLQLKFHELPK